MSSESLAVLQSSACGAEDLIKRRAAKRSGGTYQVTYSPELRSSALTLFFYSPHAYRYVRKMFDTCLPHPHHIEKWLKLIDGRPGFTSEAFDALRKRAELRPRKQLICALMMDEVAIRQHRQADQVLWLPSLLAKSKRDLYAMIRQLGPAKLFITLINKL